MSLLYDNDLELDKPFFSYNFYQQNNDLHVYKNDFIIDYDQVDNGSKFVQFLRLTFLQQSHLDMMIKSNASKNEDRFYAVLVSWKKHKHLIKHNDTVSNWNITDMLSVKLKLYEIMDDDDLFDKAKLLFMSLILIGKPITPTFATYHYSRVTIDEIEKEEHIWGLTVNYISELNIKMSGNINNKSTKDYLEDYKKEHGSIFKQNLTDIQYNQQNCYLSIKLNEYFIFKKPSSPLLNQEDLSSHSLIDNDDLKLVFIPFYTYDIPEIRHLFPLDKDNEMTPFLSGLYLLGNMNANRWVLIQFYYCEKYGEPSLIPNII
ncbi:unnamed protein product [Cunninghamella blakesleeana]